MRESEKETSGTEPTWWVKVATSIILTLGLQTGTHWANFFSARSLFLKAKGYSKEQIICLCRWLWESPTRPLGLYAVCLCDPPHRLTIYAVNDSSPWSHARAQWRQASRATAALLARHQNPGKVSLGLRPGPSHSVPQPLQENTFRTATFRAAVLTNWGAKHMKGHIETPNNQMGERETDTTENVRMCFSIYFLWAFQDRRWVRIADTYTKVISNICVCIDRWILYSTGSIISPRNYNTLLYLDQC